MMNSRMSRITGIVAFASIFLQGVQADCYSHNGVLARNSDTYAQINGYLELLPCGRNTNNCCLWNERCGTNNLCIDKNNIFKRQYCFDKNWTNCSTLAPEYDTSGLVIYQCDTNIFCYGNSACCQSTTAKMFFVDPLTGKVSDPPSSPSKAAPTYWQVDSIAILRATSSISGSLSSIPTLSSVTSSGSSSASPTGSSIPNDDCPSPGLGAGAGVGIGIGASAALAGLAGLIWLFFRERNKRKHLQAQAIPTHLEPSKDPINPPTQYYAPQDTSYAYQDVPRQEYPRQSYHQVQEYELSSKPPRHEML